MTVGILALQGAFAEHAAILDRLGAPYRFLRQARDLTDPAGVSRIDRLILPGGESTVQGQLLHATGLYTPIKHLLDLDTPTLATCAGLILLADQLDDGSRPSLGGLDVSVRRNAYGRQLASFRTRADLYDLGNPTALIPSPSLPDQLNDFPMVFIRAPYVSQVGPGAHAVAEVDGRVVGVRQGHTLALAFHPELTEDSRIHQFFLEM